jgi:hypothetical protein
MTDQQKVILVAGGIGAFLILRSKGTAGLFGTTGKPGLLSNLLPARGTNTPYLASTQMATRSGTATGPNVPSSGLGFGTTQRGVAQQPTNAYGVAATGVSSFINGLFGMLGRQSAVPAAKPGAPTQAKPPSPGAGGGGTAGAPTPQHGPLGGASQIANQQYANGGFDSRGNWVEKPGYYDNNGNYIPTDANGNALTPVDPNTGDLADYGPQASDLNYGPTPEQAGLSVDDNGNIVADDGGGLEVLDSTQTVPTYTDLYGGGDGSGFYDDQTQVFIDPPAMDAQTLDSGSTDDSLAATGGDPFGGGGDYGEGYDNFY